ncbi:hypothetical protein Salat_2760400 [Sesamum alatum]|uniref:Uncharacterized protein n=1 Tax=Sesamum alatum TaxID=300844 RepID=A0AAE2C913_9LAMI|nr:hypothetical protein Salat_2760400 [Sesamum alatum]
MPDRSTEVTTTERGECSKSAEEHQHGLQQMAETTRYNFIPREKHVQFVTDNDECFVDSLPDGSKQQASPAPKSVLLANDVYDSTMANDHIQNDMPVDVGKDITVHACDDYFVNPHFCKSAEVSYNYVRERRDVSVVGHCEGVAMEAPLQCVALVPFSPNPFAALFRENVNDDDQHLHGEHCHEIRENTQHCTLNQEPIMAFSPPDNESAFIVVSGEDHFDDHQNSQKSNGVQAANQSASPNIDLEDAATRGKHKRSQSIDVDCAGSQFRILTRSKTKMGSVPIPSFSVCDLRSLLLVVFFAAASVHGSDCNSLSAVRHSKNDKERFLTLLNLETFHSAIKLKKEHEMHPPELAHPYCTASFVHQGVFYPPGLYSHRTDTQLCHLSSIPPGVSQTLGLFDFIGCVFVDLLGRNHLGPPLAPAFFVQDLRNWASRAVGPRTTVGLRRRLDSAAGPRCSSNWAARQLQLGRAAGPRSSPHWTMPTQLGFQAGPPSAGLYCFSFCWAASSNWALPAHGLRACPPNWSPLLNGL